MAIGGFIVLFFNFFLYIVENFHELKDKENIYFPFSLSVQIGLLLTAKPYN